MTATVNKCSTTKNAPPLERNSAMDTYISLPNGKRYIYNIYKMQSDGGLIEITNHRENWKKVVQIAANRFYKTSGRQVFESAEISASININKVEAKEGILEYDVELINAKTVYKGRDGSNKTLSHNLCNVNTSSSSNIHQPRNVRTPTVIKTTDTGGRGRCLDSSIAYAILGKSQKYPNRKDTDELANQLRQKVSQKMMQENSDLDSVLEFTNALQVSIASIIQADQDNQSTVVQGIIAEMTSLTEEEKDAFKKTFYECFKALQTGNATPAQIKTCRQFYAAYILHQESDGQMQSLDSVFLYVLATTPLDNKSYKFAVFSKEAGLIAKYPKDADLDDESYIFVQHDDNSRHYEAIDATVQKNQDLIQKVIQENNRDMENSRVIDTVCNGT